jgi:hypothetical protein
MSAPSHQVSHLLAQPRTILFPFSSRVIHSGIIRQEIRISSARAIHIRQILSLMSLDTMSPPSQQSNFRCQCSPPLLFLCPSTFESLESSFFGSAQLGESGSEGVLDNPWRI